MALASSDGILQYYDQRPASVMGSYQGFGFALRHNAILFWWSQRAWAARGATFDVLCPWDLLATQNLGDAEHLIRIEILRHVQKTGSFEHLIHRAALVGSLAVPSDVRLVHHLMDRNLVLEEWAQEFVHALAHIVALSLTEVNTGHAALANACNSAASCSVYSAVLFPTPRIPLIVSPDITATFMCRLTGTWPSG